jgi:hypothetical protein
MAATHQTPTRMPNDPDRCDGLISRTLSPLAVAYMKFVMAGLKRSHPSAPTKPVGIMRVPGRGILSPVSKPAAGAGRDEQNERRVHVKTLHKIL